MGGALSATPQCQDLVDRIQALTPVLGRGISGPSLTGSALSQASPRSHPVTPDSLEQSYQECGGQNADLVLLLSSSMTVEEASL